MAQTPEGRVKAGIKKHLDAIGAWYFMPVSNGMGRHGIPDFLACIDGEFVAIEAKRPGELESTTLHQNRELNEIATAGGHAMVLDNPDDLPKLLSTMRTMRFATATNLPVSFTDGVYTR